MALFGQYPFLIQQQQNMQKNRIPSLLNAPPTMNDYTDDVVVEEDNEEGGVVDYNYGVTTNYANYGGGGGGRNNNLLFSSLSQELATLKEENNSIKSAVSELRMDRDKLRVAVRKLKVENSRFKAKLKRIANVVVSKRQTNQEGDAIVNAMEADDFDSAAVVDDLDDDFDFDNIGEFLLIGGMNDPFSLQYRSPIRDANNNEHKTLERYLWYKMAEISNDQEAMQKILTLENYSAAEEVMQNIKNYDEKAWDAQKMRHFEDGQRLKFEQYRSLKCLLIKTGKIYLAMASQDKLFGTGWRKQRDESNRPHMWDGENRGGKFLMKLRDEYAKNHTWTTAQEEQEAQNTFYENRRNIWRKTKGDSAPYSTSSRGRGNGGGGGGGGNKRMTPTNVASIQPNINVQQAALAHYYGTNGAGGSGYISFQNNTYLNKGATTGTGGNRRGGTMINKRGRF